MTLLAYIPGTDDKYGEVLADRQTVLPADFPIFSPEEVITKGRVIPYAWCNSDSGRYVHIIILASLQTI